MESAETNFDYDLSKLPRVMRGIDPDLVQLILDDANELNSKHTAEVTELRGRLVQFEDERSVVGNALIAAEKAASARVSEAEAQAAEMLDAAKKQAQAIVNDATKDVELAAKQEQAKLAELQAEVEKYTIMKQQLADDLKSKLQGWLGKLE